MGGSRKDYRWWPDFGESKGTSRRPSNPQVTKPAQRNGGRVRIVFCFCSLFDPYLPTCRNIRSRFLRSFAVEVLCAGYVTQISGLTDATYIR